MNEDGTASRARGDVESPDGFDGHYLEQVLTAVEGLGFVVDAERRLRAWNDRFAAATGEDDFAGIPVEALFLATEREAVVEGIERALETGESTAVAALETVDGAVTHDLRLTALTAPDGTAAGVVAVANPLAPGAHVELDENLALPERTHLLEQIFENVPVSLYVKDTEGRHLLISDHHDAPANAVGKTDLELYDEELGHETHDDDVRVIESGESIHNKEEYNPEEDIWVLTSKVPWYDENGEVGGLIGVTRHITEKKEYEQAIERENERLDRLAGVISHDLRNPLNVAQGRLEILAEDVDSEHVESIEGALERMETIIDDVLTLARQGESVDDPEPVGMARTTRDAWATVETADATLETGADTRFLADRSRLVELFENLFRNAVEHGGEQVTVRVAAIDDGFAVEDDGPGIPDDERGDVFEPGHTTATDGTGFGLTIVREIGSAHGWDVTVTEGTDGGARFEVTGVESVE